VNQRHFMAGAQHIRDRGRSPSVRVPVVYPVEPWLIPIAPSLTDWSEHLQHAACTTIGTHDRFRK
jgi:hypothetical protein